MLNQEARRRGLGTSSFRIHHSSFIISPSMDPKLLEIPESIETARLTLRAPRPGDGPAVNEAIRESAAELQPWMAWADPLPTVEQTESHTRASMAKFLTRED